MLFSVVLRGIAGYDVVLFGTVAYGTTHCSII